MGPRVALAYIIGFEVGAALGAALNPAHYERGWHATSSIGSLGCAAAAASILGLDVAPDAPRPRHRRLAGLGAEGELRLDDQALSTRATPRGTACGRRMLAREGLSASDTALEGQQGYVAAFGGARTASTAPSRASADAGISSTPASRSSPTRRARSRIRPSTRSSSSASAHRLEPEHVAEVRGRRHPRRPRRARATRARPPRSSGSSRCSSARRPRSPTGVSTSTRSRTATSPARRSSELMARVAWWSIRTLPRGRRAACVEPRHRPAPRRAHACRPQPRGAHGHPDHAALRRGAPRQVPGLRAAGAHRRDEDAEAVADQIAHLERHARHPRADLAPRGRPRLTERTIGHHGSARRDQDPRAGARGAGRAAGMMLADMGADVLKIETPEPGAARRPGRAPRRLRLRQPQQAQHDPQHEGARGPGGLPQAGRPTPTSSSRASGPA